MSYNYEGTAEYDTTLEYETTTQYTESTEANTQQSTPFNTMELETVQNATIGSGAVQYTTTSQPASTDIAESTEELCRDFIHGSCERVNCRFKHDITEREKSSPPQIQQLQPSNTSQEVCRDFMHGHCNRAGCKFKHDATERDNDRVNQPICKDYQKSGCHRTKCRYLHLSETEEAEFSKTGKMPVVSNDATVAMSEKPELCRDFTNGNCNRGASCRYSHGDNNNTTLSLLFSSGKRPFSSMVTSGGGNEIGMKDENEQLKTKLLDLRKQVIELTQLNDALYSENMKFRKELGGGAVDAGKIALLPSPIFSK